MSGAFVDFSTSSSDWEDLYAKEFWKVFDSWNTKWANKPTVDNLMAMVVSEGKVSGDKLLLARVVADPKSLMNSNYMDSIAFNAKYSCDDNGGCEEGYFVLSYSDRGNSFKVSAEEGMWTTYLPKWKFMTNFDANVDVDKGVGINKYSMWVAGAVNMGIITIDQLTDLTDTSFASAYTVPADDDAASTGDDKDDDGSSLAAGVTCSLPYYYADGLVRSILVSSVGLPPFPVVVA